jgi:hypothetical protein
LALAAGGRKANLHGMTPVCTLVVRTPADLIAVTPFLLGFHPADSLVVIGLAGRSIDFIGRHDLPPPGDHSIETAAPLIARQGVREVALIGYGAPGPARSAIDDFDAALGRVGVRVREALRVTGGRWFNVHCDDRDCCALDGHPVPSPHNPIAAAAVFQGHVALPNRQALVKQVAPVEGEERRKMAAATAALNLRLGEGVSRTLVGRAGRAAVRQAERKHAAGQSLTYDETALLGALLVGRTTFDYALHRISGEPWRVQQWTEVTRRVEAPFVPGPAALLGYAAWRAGLGPLARVAVDRALRQDPYHRFAGILDGLLAAGVGPGAVESFVPPVGGERRAS